MNKQVEKIRAKVEQFYQLRVKALKDDCFTGRERADMTTECGILRQVLNYIDNALQSTCSDCTNSKECINCEDGNMHEVKKKKPEGALKELLDNIDVVEYEKISREMKEYAPKEDFETFAKAYMEKETDNIICFYDRYAGLVDGVRWQKVNEMKCIGK